MNRIFKKVSVNLSPYHYDKACGLGFIGEFSFGIGKVAIILGIFIVSEAITAIYRGQGLGQVNIILELIVLPVLTVVTFYVPLISCRKAMINAKNEIINKVALEIQELMETLKYKEEPQSEDFQKFNNLVDYQQKLEKDIHTYPFNSNLLRRFSFRFVLTTIPGLMSLAIEIYGIINAA